MNTEEPTDPSDWSFQPLASLDGLMRCPICFDYFNIAVMIPNCSHNYCSLCIRRYLGHKQQCPTCLRPVTDSQLQCNRLLDEIVQDFKSNRKKFVELITSTSRPIHGSSCDSDSHVQPTSNVKLPTAKERRKSSSKGSTSAVVKDKEKKSHQSAKMMDQSVTNEERHSFVHVLESPVNSVHSTDRNTSTNSNAGINDGHLVPEAPGESQLDFSESEFSHDLEEGNVLAAGSRTGLVTNKPEGNIERNVPSTNSGRTPVADFSANITSQSNLSINESRESISMASTPSSVQVHAGSCLDTPSRKSTAHNYSTSEMTSMDHDSSRRVSSATTTTPITNNKVNCPVCGIAVLERYVNSHLDICLNQSSSSATSQSSAGGTSSLPKLPKLILTIMNDKELRKKCKDYKLSSQGSRSVLIDRIKEFTLQYNAQRDSLHPKSKGEIAQDVERAEKGKQSIKKVTATPSTPTAAQISRRKSSTSEIEESRKKYELDNDSHFSELIASIKSRATQKKKTPIIKQEGSGGAIKPVFSPSSLHGESITEPSYSPVGVSDDEQMEDCATSARVRSEGCLENGDCTGQLDEDLEDEEIIVPESPELLSKGRYSTRQCSTTTVIPESPSGSRVGSPRESLKRAKRKLSTQLNENRAATQNVLDNIDDDPDFLPVTPHNTRKKQRRH